MIHLKTEKQCLLDPVKSRKGGEEKTCLDNDCFCVSLANLHSLGTHAFFSERRAPLADFQGEASLSQIEHLDGKKVTLKKDSVTKPDEVQKIPNQGMPDFEEGHKSGHLYVKYTVRFPKKLTEQMKGLAKQMFSLMHDEL